MSRLRSVSLRAPRGVVALSVGAAVLSSMVPRAASAQGAPASPAAPATASAGDRTASDEISPGNEQAARNLFVDGSAKLKAGQAAEALPLLEKSFAIVPSPNTELLLGRAQRELGRRVDAVATLEHAAAEARRRVARGEAKYGQTETAARDEAQALRAQLGVIQVHIEGEQPSLRIDGKPVVVAADGNASTLHEPGRAEIVAHVAGTEQRQTVSVVAGGSVRTAFGAGGPVTTSTVPPTPMGPPPPPPGPAPWVVPVAITTGALALVGTGAFAFFGLRSESIYGDLETRCGNHCGDADRSDADRGETAQTIANVSLVVAAVAAVATVVVLVAAPRATPPPARPARSSYVMIPGR